MKKKAEIGDLIVIGSDLCIIIKILKGSFLFCAIVSGSKQEYVLEKDGKPEAHSYNFDENIWLYNFDNQWFSVLKQARLA